MADQSIEKPQYEKLPTLYGTESCGKPFRIIGETWERYKSSYNFRDEKVFAKRKDVTVSASEPGNFQVYDDDKKDYVAASYHDYDRYTVTRADGTVFRGRIVNSDLDPWDQDNFELDTSEGWKRVDYNSLVDGGAKVERVNHLKRVEYLPVALLELTTVGEKTVQRVKIELSKTAVDALTMITDTLLKADADPRNYIYAFTYIEADKQYVIKNEDYRKMTDDERAVAAEEDANAATSAIDTLSPASRPGTREGGDPSWMDGPKVDEIPF